MPLHSVNFGIVIANVDSNIWEGNVVVVCVVAADAMADGVGLSTFGGGVVNCRDGDGLGLIPIGVVEGKGGGVGGNLVTKV